MTPEEKENMTLSIENAMLKGFEKFAETVNEKITNDISAHKKSCPYMGQSNNQGINLDWLIKNWKEAALAMVMITWVISSTVGAIKGNPQKFTPEQVKQMAQQVQETTNQIPITEKR